MPNSMTPRKPNKNDKAWPDHWTVTFEWEFPRGKTPQTITSRQHDVKEGKVWYQFDRYVINNAKGVEWLDCFEMYPLAGWHSIRPGDVSAVRTHVEPKRPKEKKAAT